MSLPSSTNLFEYNHILEPEVLLGTNLIFLSSKRVCYVQCNLDPVQIASVHQNQSRNFAHFDDARYWQQMYSMLKYLTASFNQR